MRRKDVVVSAALDDVSVAAEELASVSASQTNQADPIAFPEGKNRQDPISLLVIEGDIEGRTQFIMSEILR